MKGISEQPQGKLRADLGRVPSENVTSGTGNTAEKILFSYTSLTYLVLSVVSP